MMPTADRKALYAVLDHSAALEATIKDQQKTIRQMGRDLETLRRQLRIARGVLNEPKTEPCETMEACAGQMPPVENGPLPDDAGDEFFRERLSRDSRGRD